MAHKGKYAVASAQCVSERFSRLVHLCMQVRYAKKLFDLQDLISGQILFKTRLYGAIVTTLVTRLKWVSLALFDALDLVTCYQGQMMFIFSIIIICKTS